MNHTTENNQNWNSLDLEMSKCHTFQRKNIFDGGILKLLHKLKCYRNQVSAKVQSSSVLNYGSI